MKDAKDYIKETGEHTSTITSLADWLTPEGLNNPVTASLLRSAIATATDEEFHEAFDGSTKDEASQHLDEWELCYMPRWGHPELVKIIILSDPNRNENLVDRVISIAQSEGELPELFTPTVGIQWALKTFYLINGRVCVWCGLQPGTYGHPHNSEASIVKSNTSQKTEWSERANTIGRAVFAENSLWNNTQIATEVHKHLTNEGVAGRGGRIPSIASIERSGLKGIKT